jgi:CDP-2,3-bis-(O-geranylgeranyl)-sn-glycerol synthase
MNDILMLILKSLYFMLPAYIANGIPVFMMDKLKFLAVPMDFGKKWRGKPILGSHKTWRGFISAIIAGLIVFAIQRSLYDQGYFRGISLFNYTEQSIWIGVLLGAGAIIGDAVKSFFKRRTDHKPGTPWIPFDQLDYVVGALLFCAIIYVPSWQAIIIIIIGSFLIHVTANHLAYYLKIKEVKW